MRRFRSAGSNETTIFIARSKAPAQSLPATLALIEPRLVARGASLQRNSAGEIRGRIPLPTGDIENPWNRSVDGAAGWCKPWVWDVR